MWCGENGKVSVVKKEKKKDTRTTWFETSTTNVPRQQRQRACWVFKTQTEKSPSTRITMWLSPGSIPKYRFSTGNVSVLIKIQDGPMITI